MTNVLSSCRRKRALVPICILLCVLASGLWGIGGEEKVTKTGAMREQQLRSFLNAYV